jgi:predicted MFS family arabinose efflux permease
MTITDDNASIAATSSQSLDWGSRVVMLTGGIIAALALMGLTAVLPQIQADLAHTANDKLLVKLLGPIVGLTMVIGSPLVGFLVDRLGFRRVLITNCVVYALAGTAGLYINSLMALLGTIVLHPVIGLLGELGWRWPFVVYSLGLVLAVVAIVGFRTPGSIARPAAAAATGEKLLSWFPFRFIPLALVIGSITYLPTVYFPFVIRTVGVTSPTVISLVLLADSVLGALLSMQFGRSQRYFSSHMAFALSFSCTGLGMAIVAMASGYAGVVVGIMVFGCGIGWFVPNLMTSAARHVSTDRQGRTVGLIKAAHYVSAPAAIAAVEPLTRAIGPTGAMWSGTMLSFTGLAVFLVRMANQRAQRSL